MIKKGTILITITSCCWPMGLALADDDLAARIELARSAAPPAISADATIVVDGEVVAEGSNGWTCLPDTMPGDGAPMCNDSVWMELLTAVGTQAPFEATRIGVSYMLQGEPEGSGVSNSTPFHPNHAHADDYVETGPHLMIAVPKSMLEGITDDPSQGGPYVMWKDTPYAHLMVPLAEVKVGND